MPSVCATARASAIAPGPQHLSSARVMQSCGQTFIVTPTTSYPCCLSRWAATEESTPPLIPITTRFLDMASRQDTRIAEEVEPRGAAGGGCVARRSRRMDWSEVDFEAGALRLNRFKKNRKRPFT